MIERLGGFQILRFCVRPERPVVGSEKMILRLEMLLFVKQLFTDLL